MNVSTDITSLEKYCAKQLELFSPDGNLDMDFFHDAFSVALTKMEYCVSHIKNKYFKYDGQPFFNHLNTDQYAMFLYFLANSLHKQDPDSTLAQKVYALNKALHALDVFYAVELPDIFLFVHSIRTVLGRAEYQNYLVVYQNVTVGGNVSLQYPHLGEGVALYSNCAVLGNACVGNNVSFAAKSMVLDNDITSDSIVYGIYPDHKTKPTRRSIRDTYFE